MSGPLISVIVPLYNSEKYIDRCILSITRQSYSDLEIILEDGGSDDGTQEICKDWQDEDSRVRYFRAEEHMGVSASRNSGIDHAKGEYITFVDSDDYVSPDMIKKLYKMITEHPQAQSSCCGFEVSHKEGIPEWMQGDNAAAGDKDVSAAGNFADKDNSNMIHSADKDNSAMSPSAGKGDACELSTDKYLKAIFLEGNTRCWSRLYRTDALNGQRFAEDLTIGEDMIFVAEFLKQTSKIVITDEKLYHYYQNRSGAMQKEYTHDSFDQVTCWERAMQILGDTPKLRSIIMISIILTVSRISCLSKKGRDGSKGDIEQCKEKLRKYRTAESFGLLDRNYRIKVRVFTYMPSLYLSIYHYLNGWS